MAGFGKLGKIDKCASSAWISEKNPQMLIYKKKQPKLIHKWKDIRGELSQKKKKCTYLHLNYYLNWTLEKTGTHDNNSLVDNSSTCHWSTVICN